MEEIRWGIIGCGNVTEIKSGPAFNKVPGSRLVAVMRRDAALAADYAARHGVPKWYADAARLINDPEVNAVYVATPPDSHLEYTLLSIAANKPVYVEKPMALDYQQSGQMVSAASKAGVKLVVAHYRRAQPMFIRIKALIEELAIGDIRLVNLQMRQPPASNSVYNWRTDPSVSGGGLFHDLAPHQLDLMCYFFGKAKKYSGISINKGDRAAADDVVAGHILFENGVVFNGTWCFAADGDHTTDSCEIYGTTGKISFSVFGNQIVLERNGQVETIDFERLAHVQQSMIEKIVAYFLGAGSNPCSGEDALDTMLLLDSFTSAR